MEKEILQSEDEEQTISIGESFANRLRMGDVVALYGDLGAGKTEFVKGVCRGLRVKEMITSPTFSIINQYSGEMSDGLSITVYHVDLYRVDSQKDLDAIGFDEMVFTHNAIKLIEWSEKAEHLIPDRHWEVRIATDDTNENFRTISVAYNGVKPEFKNR